MSLVREKNTPIYNLDKWHLESSPVTIEMYNEKIQNNQLYTILESDELNTKINACNENNLRIVEVVQRYDNLPFIKADNICYLVKLEYDENGVENKISIDENKDLVLLKN